MFNKKTAFEIINEIINDNIDSLQMSEKEKNETYKMYKKLMNESVNLNKTEQEQISLISDIILGRCGLGEGRNPESWERIFNDHSDNKHMNYFDNILGDGETDKISKALSRINKGTSVLLGIRKNQPYNEIVDGVEIIQEISENENGSPTVSKFELIYEGKVIYSFKRGIKEVNEENIEEEIEKLKRLSENIGNQDTNFRKKTNFPDNTIIEDYFVTKKGNVAQRTMGYYTDKNGKKRYGFIYGGIV